MTAPEAAQPAAVPDAQVTVGLADTPMGQRVALTLVILLGKDTAAQVADAVANVAGAMSATGLVVANGAAPKGPG